MPSGYYEERRISVRQLFTSLSEFATPAAKSGKGRLIPRPFWLSCCKRAGKR